MRRWQTDPLLKVEHLTMRFGGLIAVDDVSFDVGRQDITALIGPNGAGKTTVFNCITGFYKPTEGTMHARPSAMAPSFRLERLDDHDINAKARVARTFQNIRLFGGMTVLENLMVAQHKQLMSASRFPLASILGFGSFNRLERRGGRPCAALARPRGAHRARRRGGGRASLRRAAQARDRARHVHAASAALPRRAGGRPQCARKRGPERAASIRSATRKASRSSSSSTT